MDTVSEKVCRHCGMAYPATIKYFPPCKKVRSGLHAWCRYCMREKNRAMNKRRYVSQRKMEVEEQVDSALPAGRVVEIKRPDGMRGIRFGRDWRPAHPEGDTRALRGWACPLTMNF